MGVDVGEPGLDLGDAVGVGGGLGFGEQRAALDVGVEHEIDQASARRPAPPARPSRCGRSSTSRSPPDFGRELAAHDAEQRRLAGAVAPDEADARAGRDGDAGVVDQQALADAIGEVVDMQHGRAFAPARAARQGLRAAASTSPRRAWRGSRARRRPPAAPWPWRATDEMLARLLLRLCDGVAGRLMHQLRRRGLRRAPVAVRMRLEKASRPRDHVVAGACAADAAGGGEQRDDPAASPRSVSWRSPPARPATAGRPASRNIHSCR